MKYTELQMKELFKWVGKKITETGIDNGIVDWLFNEFENAKPSKWEESERSKNTKTPNKHKTEQLNILGVSESISNEDDIFDSRGVYEINSDFGF